jgi:hypothetical protein
MRADLLSKVKKKSAGNTGALKLKNRKANKLRLGQRVTEVDPPHAEVGIFWRAGCNEPRATRQVGILSHKLDRSILRMLPESLGPSKGALLNGAIRAVR